MQGKTSLQTVFSAEHNKSVYCSLHRLCSRWKHAKNKAYFSFKRAKIPVVARRRTRPRRARSCELTLCDVAPAKLNNPLATTMKNYGHRFIELRERAFGPRELR